MDRYGNQFATRVEKNVGVGTISADVLYTPQGMFGLSVGGVILSVQYASQEDAVDAADVILGRLAEGEAAVEVLPIEGYSYDGPISLDCPRYSFHSDRGESCYICGN